MYGILKARKCKLNKCQYQTFQAYYCGLCDALSKNFGSLTRLSVNYDMTFFYLLLDSFSDTGVQTTGSCPISPLSKREIIINPALHSYMAAANLYLVGLKLRDDIQDEQSWTKQAGYQLLRSKLTAAENILRQLGVDVARVQALFTNQQIIEVEGHTLAEYCRATAEGLAFFLAEGARLLKLPAHTSNLLTEVAVELGKVIYIMDSFVDYPSDTQNDQFNALAQVFGDQLQIKEKLPPVIRAEIYIVLNTSLEHVEQLLNTAGGIKHRDLITRILTDLQWKVKELVCNTEDMRQVEEIVNSASPLFLLKHPGYFFKSRAARHKRRSKDDDAGEIKCWTCENLTDCCHCSCDTLDCLSSENPCDPC